MPQRLPVWTLVALLWAAGSAWPAECPPALTAAAEAYRQRLNREQEAVRKSTLSAPRGVEGTMMFDRASHGCHEGKGQAYRVYETFRCTEGDGGTAVVRYPYRLFFRRAPTVEELFEKPWKPGSDGILEVEFQREGNRWIPVSRREVLDLGDAGAPSRGRPPQRPAGPPR